MKLFDRQILSVDCIRWFDKYYINILLAALVLVYFGGYFACSTTPGNNQQFPLGWWGWFDQGKYLLSSKAISNLDFSPANHFYPPLYPMLGALFVRWSEFHPFWLVNLVSFMWFCVVFVLLASKYIPRWSAVLLLFISVISNHMVFENFLIPWTSTVVAALLSTAIYGLVCIRDSKSVEKTSILHPTALMLLGISLSVGLIAPLRPGDAIVGGVLWIGCMWMAFRLFCETSPNQVGFFIRIFLLSNVCMIVGLIIFFGFNYLVFGSAMGGYFQAASSNGFFPADLAEKFVSIFLDGYTLYLEPNSSLTDHYPWLFLSLVAMVYFLLRGDWVLKTIALAICVHFVLYLPYGDLLPNGLWRFKNIHYFKWMFPYLALFALLLCVSLVKEWRINKRKSLMWIGVTLVSLLLLLSIKMQVDFKDVVSLTESGFDSSSAQSISFELDSDNTDLFDVTGLQGNFTEIYFGKHKLWADGLELKQVKDFRVLPALKGVRVLFIRPIQSRSIKFQPDAVLMRTEPKLQVLTGSYHFMLDVPKLPSDRINVAPASVYKIGDLIDFSVNGNSDKYTGEGWSVSESWGRWTDGKGATLRFRLDSTQNATLVMHFRMGAFVNDRHPRQIVDVKLNDSVISRLIFRADQLGDKPQDVTLDLPPHLIAEDGELKLLLSTPQSMSPQLVGAGDDKRLLGVGLSTLKITH